MAQDNESISSEKVGILDKNARYWGVPTYLLMECAGFGVMKAIKQRRSVQGSRAIVFCGNGNNGGDGFVVARHLAAEGAQVSVILLGPPEKIRTEESRLNWNIIQGLRSIECIIINDSTEFSGLQINLQEDDLLVDALLGTGVRGKVREPYASAISYFNQLPGFKVAVDIPSGIDPDTGEVNGDAIRADLCVTFHRPKLGLQAGTEYITEMIVSEIGIPLEAELYVGMGDIQTTLWHRDKFTHKGLNGRVLVVGGSENFAGAPSLVALGAQTLGVDLIRIAAPEVIASTIRGYSPNLIVSPLQGNHLQEDHIAQLEPLIDWADAIVIGPGLGTADGVGDTIVTLLDLLIAADKSFVLDADALKPARGHIARGTEIPAVMTPHAGEFFALTGNPLPDPGDLEGRKVLVKTQAEQLGCVILLKGPTDVIASPTEIKLNATGVAPMSVGGTGDVLAGLVGAFLAQRVSPFRAACAGVFLNGLYGREAVQAKGEYITATDLLTYAPAVLKKLM